MVPRSLSAAAVVATSVLLLGPRPVHAEVSVNTDPDGNYCYTSLLVEAGEAGIRFWTPVRAIDPTRVLNPDGDEYGDGPPALVDASGEPFPLAVWSRGSGGGRYLVWSRWEANGWRPAGWVHGLPGPFVDRDPVLVAAPDGSVHLVWWREEGGPARMYWSRYLVPAGWSQPIPVACRSSDHGPAHAASLPFPPVPVLLADGRSDRCVPVVPTSVYSADSGSNGATTGSGAGNGLTDDPDVLP
ncbi:MAG: hypothetical protein HY509_04190 [Acidobacteria bacterium]|nr:hypothetical protein [Acidobacteriota bacterium]